MKVGLKVLGPCQRDLGSVYIYGRGHSHAHTSHDKYLRHHKVSWHLSFLVDGDKEWMIVLE